MPFHCLLSTWILALSSPPTVQQVLFYSFLRTSCTTSYQSRATPVAAWCRTAVCLHLRIPLDMGWGDMEGRQRAGRSSLLCSPQGPQSLKRDGQRTQRAGHGRRATRRHWAGERSASAPRGPAARIPAHRLDSRVWRPCLGAGPAASCCRSTPSPDIVWGCLGYFKHGIGGFRGRKMLRSAVF